MKIKIKKRIVAFVLMISMVLEMVTAGVVTSNPGDVMAAASNKITEKNIYLLAPEYLNNYAYSHYFDLCAERMKAGIDDVTDSQEGFAVFWESIKSGADIITRNVLALFGQGRDYEDEFKYNLVKEILFEYMQTDTFAQETISTVDKSFSNVKTISKASKEWNAASYKAELKAAKQYLSDSDIDKIVDTYVEDWKTIAETADIVTDGVDVAQFVTTALMMNEIENKALDDLEQIFAEYDMDLVDAIAAIKAEKNDFLKYFRNTYLNDKVRGAITGALKSVSGYSTASLAIKVADLILNYTVKPVSASDIITATLAYGYAIQADAAVSDYINTMMRKKIAGETVSDEYIERFETAYNFMIAAYIVGLEKASKCVKNKTYLKDAITQIKEPLGSSVNFASYLDSCVKTANEAVANGTLVISSNTVVKKTPDGTVIDESYDSTASITAKLAAIKEKYPTGTTWTGSFDGAYQCFGFAKLVFYNLFGNYLGTTYQSGNMYQYNATSTAYLVGQVTGSNVTSASVKNLMASAKIGDLIQGYGMGGYQRGQHTMVFLGLTQNGIEVYDCNSHLNGDTRDCVINQWTISYDTLALYYGTGSSASGNGLSVYRASNYNEIYGDGTTLFYDDSVNFVVNNGVLTKYNGSQTYVTIPDTVTSIGESAFKNNTSMMYVEIPDTVTSIGASAFYGCKNLVSVNIPDSVRTIGSSAFYNCTSLASAYLPENEDYAVVSQRLFYSCTRLKGVVIPDTVTIIESYAFADCANLTEVTIPDSVTTIRYSAFSNCTKLETIIIPDSVVTIESSAFSSCTGLKNVTLSKSLEIMEFSAFYNCDGLTQIEIPKSLKVGGVFSEGAFYKCSNLKQIIFEEGIATMPQYLFNGCDGIEKIVIPDTVTKIESSVFKKCDNLAEVTIPDSVTTIEGCAFADCANLTEVTISDGVTTIGQSAFLNCTKLETIVIPDSVTTLGYSAFSGCSTLKTVSLSDNIKEIQSSTFYNCKKLSDLKLPKNLKTVGSQAFYNCDALTEIEFPYGTTSIGNNVLQDAGSLTKVVIPNTVTSLGSGAFYDCISLKEVVWGSGIKQINAQTFYGCTALPRITIPETVTKIGSEVFKNCVKLYDVSVPQSVTSIPLDAFSYPKKTTIYGYKDSYAEAYSSEKGINFVAVEKKEENSAENITVEYDIFEIPDNAAFVTGRLSEKDAEYQSIAKTLEEKNISTAYEAYSIKLVDADNRQVQPTGELQIQVELPLNYQAAAAKVYRVEEDGTFTDMNAAYEDGKLVFASKYLAAYLVAEGELKEESGMLFGDANSDGAVDSKDAVLMKKHLAGYTDLGIDLSASDVNADGIVDSKDAVRLLKYLAGYDVKLGQNAE